ELAERAEPELRGAGQSEWLQRLEEEHDNFRAALEHLLSRRAVEEGLRLGASLMWFWWLRGYLSEGRERLQALLAHSGYEPDPDGVVRKSGAGCPEREPATVRLAQAK